MEYVIFGLVSANAACLYLILRLLARLESEKALTAKRFNGVCDNIIKINRAQIDPVTGVPVVDLR